MTCLILVGVGFTLGLFTALLLYAWLDERSDRYAGIAWSPALGVDSQYAARASLTAPTITTFCPYCQETTTSRYCAPCRVHYCTRHNTERHRLCGPQAFPAWRPRYGSR